MYNELNDYELLHYVHESEEASEILINKYKPFINSLASKMSKYSYGGVDINDFMQEGMLGLNDAINNFDEAYENTFYTFAKTCIERRMLSLLTSTKRLKNKILNDSIPFEVNDGEIVFDKFLADNTANPLDVVIDSEWEVVILEKLNQNLTDFESQVFQLKKNQFDYKEIADMLDRTPKAIDNAIQRIKLKLKDILKEN